MMNNASAAQALYQAFAMNDRVKIAIVTFVSAFFISLNAFMVYTLRSKDAFKETPRYALFAHMLVNDSFQLLFTLVLYILSIFMHKITSYACAFLVFLSKTTFTNSPLNLAGMSLERYVAICFPLRHAQIATLRRTYAAVGAMWFIGSLNFLLDFFSVLATNPTFLTGLRTCNRDQFLLNPWQVDVLLGFNIVYFVSVTMIIIFCYVSIMIAARSYSSDKEPATKAHKTVLLHMVQLGLCSTSFLFMNIEQAAAKSANSATYSDLRYINYLFVLILPRCLSPLIYGLRDDALRQIFMHYLCSARKKRHNVINIH